MTTASSNSVNCEYLNSSSLKMDGFLDDVVGNGPCSECRLLKSDYKRMLEQVTFLSHQVVQVMRVLCIGNCRCPSCQAFIASSKNSPKTNGFVGLGGDFRVDSLQEDENDIEMKLLNNNSLDENSYGALLRRCSNSRKRHVVGVDQILPKLLAERVSGEGAPSCDVGNEDDFDDNDETSPRKDSNLLMRISGAVNSSTSTDAGSQMVDADDNSAEGDSFDDDDKMDDGGEAHRRWIQRRQRFSDDFIDSSRANGTLSAGDRSCFLNESPCSSGSLELPKTSASATNGSLDITVDDGSTIDDRDPKYVYASAVATMSAGLPLVMPGPKATTFFCTICNREFSNVYYKRHMIVHANSRPYVCDVCGKRFNERSNMMKHKQRLHGP